MRILFISDFYSPEVNAAASRVAERARYWVKWGHEVVVITSVPNFPEGKAYAGYENLWYQEESIDGVRIIRVKTYLAENAGRWRRMIDMISFFFTALPVALVQSKCDAVVATSPNFFAGLVGCFYGIARKTPFVLEIGDLWPAFVVTMGAMRRSLVIRILEALELFMYRRAKAIVCLSDGFRENLIGRGIDASKVQTVLNGVEIDNFKPGEADCNLSRKYDLDGRFVVGYFGTQGLAHGLESTLDAAARLPSVQFLFVGGGAMTKKLKRKRDEMNLSNVVFIPPQLRNIMPELLRLCDVALVQLRDLPMLNMAIPSKIFEAMASAKPILLAAPDGNAATLVRSENCGLHVPPGDPRAFVEAIEMLEKDDDFRNELGLNGYKSVHRYSRERQAHLTLEAVQEVVDQSP